MSCYQFIQAQKACFPASLLCRVLEVSRAGSCAWVRRGPSARARADEALTEQIRAVPDQSRATHGVPRIHAA